MRELIDVLKRAGKPARLIRAADGTRVLVLPHGGRVLGLFSPESEENFYWTHTALATFKTARAFYKSDQWHNSGGDRTWLAPEVDLFLPNFPKLDGYFQPRSLDPGDYQVAETPRGFGLVNRLQVKLSRLGESVSLKLTKSFGAAPNPLRHERKVDLTGVEYAGYSQHTTLELLGPSRATQARVGLWNLVQMPHGGDLLIPTYSRTEPLRVFGSIPDADLVITDHLLRYRMRQKGEHKISVRAVATCGRVGYLHSRGSTSSLIVRNFTVNPSGEYVDVPWSDPEYLGFSTQACNVNSGLGQFSELEYHIPAIGGDTGMTCCEDEAQVWAFRGAKARITRICRLLVG